MLRYLLPLLIAAGPCVAHTVSDASRVQAPMIQEVLNRTRLSTDICIEPYSAYATPACLSQYHAFDSMAAIRMPITYYMNSGYWLPIQTFRR